MTNTGEVDQESDAWNKTGNAILKYAALNNRYLAKSEVEKRLKRRHRS